MAKVALRPAAVLYPVPAVMVSCVGEDGKPNIITLGWVGTVCSEPPMVSVSIRPPRYSHGLVEESGEFVVNMPTADLVRQTELCGTISGRDGDKFEAAGLTAEPASVVKAPLIKECPVNIECRVRHTLRLGTHDMYVGEIVAVHADESVLGSNRTLDVSKLQGFARVAMEYRALGERLQA
jgi:flavin reductase (DIM6/NTAB) family NADH-FMN oxidoreductase RutF